MTLAVYYGGTFDPVHAGHLAVALAARDALGTQIRFVPAADPPHRAAPGADAVQRAEMLELAIAGTPGLVVDRRELDRAEPSWTVVTLEGLRGELGASTPLAWLLGADAFRGLPSWHRWRELFALAHLVVAVRPGHALEPLPAELADACTGRWTAGAEDLCASAAGRVHVLAMPPHPATSTRLRRALLAGEPAGDWLAPAVAAYIARHGLYTGGARPPGV